MRLRPRRPLIDVLRDVLRTMDAEPEPETPNSADLKRIVRERIVSLEAVRRLGSKSSNPEKA